MIGAGAGSPERGSMLSLFYRPRPSTFRPDAGVMPVNQQPVGNRAQPIGLGAGYGDWTFERPWRESRSPFLQGALGRSG